MIAQAKAEYPNECCGILAGRRSTEGQIAKVEQRYPLVNALASPVEFLSDDSIAAAHRAMREAGLEELAIYHSHPTSPAIPSRKDLEANEQTYRDTAMTLIISLEEGEPAMQGWWLTAVDYRPAEWKIVES